MKSLVFLYKSHLMQGLFFTAIFSIAIVTERSNLPIREEMERLHQKLTSLQKSVEEKETIKKELQEVLMSQSDIEWQRQTLMRVLGVIPENMQKVIFHPET